MQNFFFLNLSHAAHVTFLALDLLKWTLLNPVIVFLWIKNKPSLFLLKRDRYVQQNSRWWCIFAYEHAYGLRMGALFTALLTFEGLVQSLIEREIVMEKLKNLLASSYLPGKEHIFLVACFLPGISNHSYSISTERQENVVIMLQWIATSEIWAYSVTHLHIVCHHTGLSSSYW